MSAIALTTPKEFDFVTPVPIAIGITPGQKMKKIKVAHPIGSLKSKTSMRRKTEAINRK
jgi:hypothetical protein